MDFPCEIHVVLNEFFRKGDHPVRWPPPPPFEEFAGFNDTGADLIIDVKDALLHHYRSTAKKDFDAKGKVIDRGSVEDTLMHAWYGPIRRRVMARIRAVTAEGKGSPRETF